MQAIMPSFFRPLWTRNDMAMAPPGSCKKKKKKKKKRKQASNERSW